MLTVRPDSEREGRGHRTSLTVWERGHGAEVGLVLDVEATICCVLVSLCREHGVTSRRHVGPPVCATIKRRRVSSVSHGAKSRVTISSGEAALYKPFEALRTVSVDGRLGASH